jgi:hypothetical protein
MVAVVSGSAAASNSTCGWVLWIHETSMVKASPSQPLKEWLIYDAYDSLKDCNDVKKSYLDVSVEEAGKEKKDGKIESFERHGNSIFKKMSLDNPLKTSERQTFYCLPGTLDPRERE